MASRIKLKCERAVKVSGCSFGGSLFTCCSSHKPLFCLSINNDTLNCSLCKGIRIKA